MERCWVTERIQFFECLKKAAYRWSHRWKEWATERLCCHEVYKKCDRAILTPRDRAILTPPLVAGPCLLACLANRPYLAK